MAEEGSPPGESDPTNELLLATPKQVKFGSRSRLEKKLPLTVEGDKTAGLLKSRLSEMLDSSAQVEAKRREATSVDAPDYQAAFRIVVAPSKKQLVRNVSLDFIGLLGGSLIAYAINIITGSGDRTTIALSLIGGVPLAAIAIFFKYLRD